MHDPSESVFERRKKAPLWWWNKAEALHCSATRLWMIEHGLNITDEIIQSASYYDKSIKACRCVEVYEMLSGLSLEVICKGIIVAEGQTPEDTHDLCSLAESAGIHLGETEKLLMELLTHSIYWVGKYPVPKEPKGKQREKDDRYRDYIDKILEANWEQADGSKFMTFKGNICAYENYVKMWNKCTTVFWEKCREIGLC